jgi:hypothetical protein
MQNSLITADAAGTYSSKEFGPIILALAFVIALGGLTAAAIVMCGWRGAKSMGMNLAQRQVAIVCR